MGKDLNPSAQATLENLVDVHGLCAVLQSLSSVCDEKADHIRASYDDQNLARAWRLASAIVGIASCDAHVMRVGEP